MWPKVVLPQLIEMLPHAQRLVSEYLQNRRQSRDTSALSTAPVLEGNAAGGREVSLEALLAAHVALQGVCEAQSAAIRVLDEKVDTLHTTLDGMEARAAHGARLLNRAILFGGTASLLSLATLLFLLLHHAR